MNKPDLAALSLLAGVILPQLTGCVPFPARVSAPTELWALWAPSDDSRQVGASAPSSAGFYAAVGSWIELDSSSFRPAIVPGSDGSPIGSASRNSATMPGFPPARPLRFTMVTSFQGSRYHPEVIRGMAESGDAVAVSAGSIASLLSEAGTNGVLLDFQGMTADDLESLMDVSRAIRDSGRTRLPLQLGMIIPAADSAGYPARALARIAEVLIVRLFPEHGAGTAPGPIVSPAWFARRLGARAGDAGITRIVAGIPADGILWSSSGGARRISHSEASRLAESAGTVLVRDPASRNLHASSSRDGWELWVADHELIATLVAEGRRAGVTRFALFGLEDADPQLWQSLPQLLRR